MGLRWLLTVACLWVAWRWWRQRPALEALHIQGSWCALALALAPLIILLRSLKWRACLGGLQPQPSTWQALRSYVGAMPLALVTPGRAGELARPLYFKAPELRHIEVSGRLLLDNWTDTLAVLLWALPGCAWLWGWRGLWPVLAALVILAAIPLWLTLAHRFFAWPFLGQVGQWALKILPPPEVATGRLLTASIGWGLLAYAVESLQFWSLLRGVGEMGLVNASWQQAGISWLWMAGGLALVHLANSVQVTVAGIGPREGLTVWLLAKLGLSEGALFSASFLQTALLLLLPAAMGLGLRPAVAEKPREMP